MKQLLAQSIPVFERLEAAPELEQARGYLIASCKARFKDFFVY